MEIEYESPPRFQENAVAGPSYSDEEDEVEQQDEPEDAGGPEVEGEGEEEGDAEGEEGEDEGGVEAQAAPKVKAKRIIKSRQSLSEKQPGTTLFPIARIKKIIKADKDVDTMSTEATFLIAVATEYFIQHFMEEGYTKARLDKRKIVNYRDLASVVQRSDEFNFLQDVIPMPITMSEALNKRKQKQLQDENPTIHDDLPASSSADALPPLTGSKNPLFPNAVIKKPANSHAKGAGARASTGGAGAKGVSEHSDDDDIQEMDGPARPAKNGGTPSHSHGTRRARKSGVADDDEELNGTTIIDDDAMDED